ncbi:MULTISPECIES: Hpt domain-containing protein [Lysobacter]|uniref:Hpt domain-containing protein n=1 Tax=Lysobacter TaxID=68 RepID=UPI0004D03BC6|nr:MULTISPECIES: Hpt domain-containing protein [Lysobacter]
MKASNFEPLSRLLRGDTARVRRVLDVFARCTGEDLQRLDRAWASRDWATIGALTHKMKSGCLQIGETAAAQGLASIERAVSAGSPGDCLGQTFASTRDELDRVMMRVLAYLAYPDEAGET